MRKVDFIPVASEIDVLTLKSAINAILDHLTEDLGIRRLTLDQDCYWDLSEEELYDVSRQPIGLTVGQLTDDVDFVSSISRGQSGDATLNLVHVVPLLRYIAEKVKR